MQHLKYGLPLAHATMTTSTAALMASSHLNGQKATFSGNATFKVSVDPKTHDGSSAIALMDADTGNTAAYLRTDGQAMFADGQFEDGSMARFFGAYDDPSAHLRTDDLNSVASKDGLLLSSAHHVLTEAGQHQTGLSFVGSAAFFATLEDPQPEHQHSHLETGQGTVDPGIYSERATATSMVEGGVLQANYDGENRQATASMIKDDAAGQGVGDEYRTAMSAMFRWFDDQKTAMQATLRKWAGQIAESMTFMPRAQGFAQ